MLISLNAAALPAQTDAFCQHLDGFLNDKTQQDVEVFADYTPFANSGPKQCGASISLDGSTSRHCYWSFDYRAGQARKAFETTLSDIAVCLQGDVQHALDPEVNHPDSYDLRAFDTPEGVLSASLKDKGALQKTLLFLRFSPRE